MAIQVTCPGCGKRFTVSDKFAGQKGPCPSCKKEILVPKLEEQVEIHAPENFGPKDSQGKSVLKPITREESPVGVLQIVGIVAVLVIALVGALAVRFTVTDPADSQLWIFLGCGAVLLGPVVSYAGYFILRDQDLAPFRGSALYLRLVICGGLYAASWMLMPLVAYTVGDYEFVPVMVGAAIMIAIGGGIALASFEMDYLMGILHYGFYFAICVGLRFVAGVGVLPFVSDS